MSASTQSADAVELNQTIRNKVFGGAKTTENAQTVYDTLCRGWDLPQTPIGDGMTGVQISRFKNALWQSHQRYLNEDLPAGQQTRAERLYGTKHPFVASMLAGPRYEEGDGLRDIDTLLEYTRGATPDNGRGLVDDGIVKAASPVEVDPLIVDIQRENAPVIDIISAIAQPGFQAQFNVFDGRTLNGGYMTEAEAADLTDNTGSEFSIATDTEDMKIMAELINVSDFSQRAEATLDYMDLMNTTVGQVMKEVFLRKAKTYFYGDPSQDEANFTHESGEAFPGLAKFASDGSNVTDKKAVTSGRLEDLLDYITDQTQTSGLTFGNARTLVSPAFYNAIYDEVTPVVRIGGYEEDVEFGPSGLAIGHERGTVPITPCDNIRDYQSESAGVGSNSTDGDVFIYDERSIQFRQLTPMSTVPLGRVGLADRAALFEYGTLIDKSQGNHTHRLRYGDV